jgi:tetratricopeptide (TPR) repeat protein
LIAWLIAPARPSWWAGALFVLGGVIGMLGGLALRARAIMRKHAHRTAPMRARAQAQALPAAASPPEQPASRSAGPRAYLVPIEIPPPQRHFVGREAESALIIDHLRRLESSGPRCVVISGQAGIGKSALAVHVAHLVANDYPDGILFARLGESAQPGGADDDRAAQALHAVAGSFIDALQGPGEDIPAELAQRLALFRELTSERRVLVVLDDVTRLEVACQLLPASARGAALLTSRESFDVVGPGQLDVRLDQLPEEAGLHLLEAIVGPERIAQGQKAAREIVQTLSCHPLALTLAGKALAARPHWDLRIAVQRMRDSRATVPGATPLIAGSLDMSYALLTADEQRAVRLLPLLPARTFAPWMLAALLDVPESAAWRIAGRLVVADLVERSRDDATGVPEFRVLDHVWDYATARAAAGPEEQAARARRADEAEHRRHLSPQQLLRRDAFVLHESGCLHKSLNTARNALALARENDDRRSAGLALAALAEFTAELGNLDDAEDLAQQAIDTGDTASRVRGLRCLGETRRRLRDLETAHGHVRAGLDLLDLVDSADTGERIRLLRELAVIHAFRGEHGAGLEAANAAADLCRQRDDRGRRHVPGVLWARGLVHLQARDFPAARADLKNAHAKAVEVGFWLWAAWIDYASGLVDLATDEHAAAADVASRALRCFNDMRHRYGNARCRVLLARVDLATDATEAAADSLAEALETFRNCGDRWIEADTSLTLATVEGALGRPEQARRRAQIAARLFTALGDDDKLRRAGALLVQLDTDASAPARAGQ